VSQQGQGPTKPTQIVDLKYDRFTTLPDVPQGFFLFVLTVAKSSDMPDGAKSVIWMSRLLAPAIKQTGGIQPNARFHIL
jgi:hypothetical protein